MLTCVIPMTSSYNRRSAAGAVGLVAAQVAKALGGRVVGATGSDAKVQFLESCGIKAFNYRGPGGYVSIRLALVKRT